MMAKNNKTIGILTFHSALSYGAAWQTYALYSFIKDRNQSVSVINLNSSDFSIRAVPIYKNPFRALAARRFIRFHKELNLTVPYWDGEIRHNFPMFDLYIIGSDQVWNPDITRQLKDIYYGDICPKSSKKISYAASFGRYEFTGDEQSEISRLIHDFSKVSIREQTGVELYRQIKNEDAVRVLDPTFLIQNYKERFNLPDSEKNLCVFILDNNSVKPFEIAKMMGKSLKLKPTILNKNRPVKGCRIVPVPSPVRWLKELSQSGYILTNSFHGLAFALHLHKNFSFVSTNSKLSSRARDLLDTVGLKDRFFESYEDVLKSNVWKNPINYDIVENKLAPLRAASMQFLIDALTEQN